MNHKTRIDYNNPRTPARQLAGMIRSHREFRRRVGSLMLASALLISLGVAAASRRRSVCGGIVPRADAERN